MNTENHEHKSDFLLEEIRKRKESKTESVDQASVKVVVFSLRDDWFAFPGSDIKEILPRLPVYPVPGTPDFIPGLINVRGTIESVITLDTFLGLPGTGQTEPARIAIAEKDGIRSGILVQSIEDVLDIPVTAVKPTLSTIGKSVQQYVSGEFVHRGRLVAILDIAKIFSRISV